MGGGLPPDNLQTRDEEGNLKSFATEFISWMCSKKKKKDIRNATGIQFPSITASMKSISREMAITTWTACISNHSV